ncbi:MAG: hypothetical protein AAF587_14410 [Bacteroidota bacterium]
MANTDSNKILIPLIIGTGISAFCFLFIHEIPSFLLNLLPGVEPLSTNNNIQFGGICLILFTIVFFYRNFDPFDLLKRNLFSLENIRNQPVPTIEDILKQNLTVYRLYSEIVRIRSGSYYNLILGISANVFVFLIVFNLDWILELPRDINQTQEIFLFISKVLFTIALEGVSLFFLNQYQKNVKEIRDLHHEITTIEQRMLALQIGSANKSDGGIDIIALDNQSKILTSLLQTDRRKSVEATSDKSETSQDGQILKGTLASFMEELTKLTTQIQKLVNQVSAYPNSDSIKKK